MKAVKKILFFSDLADYYVCFWSRISPILTRHEEIANRGYQITRAQVTLIHTDLVWPRKGTKSTKVTKK